MPASDFQILVDRRFNNGVPMDSFTETTREALLQQSIGSVVCTLREHVQRNEDRVETDSMQGPKFTRMMCCIWRGKNLAKVM